jgi:2-oxoisovalerate dehydrogenase E1 component alpha subunit
MTKGRGAGGESAPEFVQLLTPDGERIDKVTGADGVEYTVEFTDDEYRGLYRDLVVVRKLDAEATALQRQGELGIWASLLGQEAAQVGSGRALRPQDMAFPTYREHGVLYCRGIDPIMPLSLFRGVDHGAWDPVQFRFNMYTIVIGAQTLHATGYAMGITKDGKVGNDDGEAVIAYFGDGASAQGDVNEAFIWASVFTTSTRSRSRSRSRPGCRCTSGPPASASRAYGSTATTCSPRTRSPGPPSTTPATARAPP